MEKIKQFLTPEEERQLIAKYQNDNDQEALDILVETHSAYVQKIASKEYIKFNKAIEYEDLVQQGKIGLIKAIKKFKLDRISINPETNKKVINQRLLTYAHMMIIAEIQNLFHNSPALHIPTHTLRAIFYKVKNPGGNTEERKNMARNAIQAESLEHYNRIEHHSHSEDPTFEEGISNVFSPAVKSAIAKLTEEEFKVFSMRYGLEQGIPTKMAYIANELNMPLEDVERILKRAKKVLSRYLMSYNKKAAL